MRIGLGLKIMFLNITFIFITAGALIYFSYTTARQDLENSIGGRLEAIAASGALMLDGDLHDTIQTAEDAESEAFIKMRDRLRALKKANNLETEVYTFRQEGDNLKFIVMTNEKPYIGHTYDIKEEMWPALKKGEPSHTSIYRDKHGYWLSAYAPILDSKGQISGILDVDIELHTFKQQLAMKTVRLATISAVIFVLAIIMSLALSHRLVKQLRYLTEVTEKISMGQTDRTIKVSSRDEVSELAESLERMRESLKVAFSMIDEEDDDE
ncbi:HAMP domain-containing protein [candidate division CSSED10-310 bacterium]|uniref:histidine kinase n=1 Tax=candidate division CSSED10-310 bacterium TaxID=2855610 RepID=A0ABV6YYK7_UNCC1